jgi:antitoxin component YwqK of YwqJK toxin-antitoxin module
LRLKKGVDLMKKSLLMASLVIALTACSTTQTTTKITDKENIYFKENKAYNIIDDGLFSGITKEKETYGDSIEIVKFENGIISNYKKIEDGNLIKKISFDSKGNVKGSFYNKEYSEIYDGTVVNNLFSGTIKNYSYYNDNTEDYFTFQNGLLHGKSIEDGIEQFYNKGMLVSGINQVEKMETPEEFENVISANIVEFDNNTVKVKDIDSFNGWVTMEDYDEITYFKVENNKIKEKRVFYSETLDNSNYLKEIKIFSPMSVTIYNEDGSSNVTSYSFYNSPGKFESYKEYDKNGEIDGKVIEIDYYGVKTVKTQKGNTLIGETHLYDKDGSILEVHSYNENGYTLLAYYDFENKVIRVEGQGQKIDDQYYRTGNWKWYYKNGQVEYEADFNYDEQYSYVKNFYENGNLKSEGKMDYCACVYIGELKEYNEDGTLNMTTTYDENGTLLKQKINE